MRIRWRMPSFVLALLAVTGGMAQAEEASDMPPEGDDPSPTLVDAAAAEETAAAEGTAPEPPPMADEEGEAEEAAEADEAAEGDDDAEADDDAVSTTGEDETIDPAAGGEVEPPPGPLGFFDRYHVHGFVKGRYLGRTTDGESDHDLRAILSVDIGDQARHRVTGHLLGEVSADLDGNTQEDGYHPFTGPRDAIGSSVDLLVYSAYVNIHEVPAVSVLRVGRQTLYGTPELSYFDGVRIEADEIGSQRVVLGAYGGFPVQLYEDDEHLGSDLVDDFGSLDLIGGVYGTGDLWQGARMRLDVQHLEGHTADGEHEDLLSSIGVWQSVGEWVDLHAAYTRENSEDRDILARGTFSQPEWDLIVQASYFEQMLTRRAALSGADAYYPILKEYVPYREYRALVSKGISDNVYVDAGVTIRRLDDDQEESDFNHDFERYFLTLQVEDLFKEGSFLSLTVQRWVTDDRGTETQGLEFTWPIDEKSEVSVGTSHYLYKYDYWSDDERFDVQDYFLVYERDHSEWLRFRAEYSLEDDDSSDLYHELRCEVTCYF